MSGSKKDAAVTTYADHEVITPPNMLKKAVVRKRSNDPADMDPVAAAERALAELSSEFTEWMHQELQRLERARLEVQTAGFTADNRDELFRVAHDIRGQADTFGFPLITPLAESLCRLIEHTPDPKHIPLKLLDQHVDGIRAILNRNTSGDPASNAEKLANRLRQVTDEFLAQVNRHRPDYLEGILAPPLAPRDDASR
jgi:HPt (histidine-containing phosphotransfer) domain-containing protein